MCPGDGNPHWCGPCCKSGGRCLYHKRSKPVPAHQLYKQCLNVARFTLHHSCLGGVCPSSVSWPLIRSEILASQTQTNASSHVMAQHGQNTIQEALYSLSYSEVAVFTLSELAPINSRLCLQPYFVGNVRCTTDSLQLCIHCFAPLIDSQYSFNATVFFGNILIIKASVRLSLHTKTQTWINATSFKQLVTGTIPETSKLIARFYIQDDLNPPSNGSPGLHSGGTKTKMASV